MLHDRAGPHCRRGSTRGVLLMDCGWARRRRAGDAVVETGRCLSANTEPVVETGSNLGSKLRQPQPPSQALRPVNWDEPKPVILKRSGWGPGGRRFKSCLPDYKKSLLSGQFLHGRVALGEPGAGSNSSSSSTRRSGGSSRPAPNMPVRCSPSTASSSTSSPKHSWRAKRSTRPTPMPPPRFPGHRPPPGLVARAAAG